MTKPADTKPASGTDTPRTDQMLATFGRGGDAGFLPASFGRQLERELAALRERLAKLEQGEKI